MKEQTERLQHLQGETVKVTYNVACDSSKFTFVGTGKLIVYSAYYEIIITGDTHHSANWIHFTDDNIRHFDGEQPYWIELK